MVDLDLKIPGGGCCLKKIVFDPLLWASVWSKKSEGGRGPGPRARIHHWESSSRMILKNHNRSLGSSPKKGTDHSVL